MTPGSVWAQKGKVCLALPLRFGLCGGVFSALGKHCVSGVQSSLLTECTTERVSLNLMILCN